LPDYNEQYQKGLIITDDIAIDPILDFNLYRDAIVNIIRNSYPKFTIGIFGDWGTGKSTLMDSIDKKIQYEDKDIVIVRFETWRYEREEQFALIPLLKTIAFALPEKEQFQDLKHKLKRGAINFIKKTPDIVSSILSNYINEDLGMITKEAFDSFKKEFNSKMELIAEVDRDTLYFDGFDDIKNEIIKIRNKTSHFKIVVFIDDLDRCSPKKTLEVLESIKVFLGMEGFVYVIGLSHDIVTKLIDIEYKESGIKGEQYIKKIIQIPITLPKWDNQDVINLVKDFVKKEIIDNKYKKTIGDNIELISTAIENNPREIKRFLNNFIVAFEIFSPSRKVVAKELLVIQAIQLRWNKFYDLLIKSDDDFRKKLLIEVSKYIKMGEDKRIQILGSDHEKQENYDLKISKLLRDFKSDTEFWRLLERNDILDNIKDWTIYRRATEISHEPIIESGDPHSKILVFLKNKKIDEFNSKRRAGEFVKLDLSNIDLHDTYLEGADLGSANLENANLRNANLRYANLWRANLNYADLRSTNLRYANLTFANLWRANLNDADLRSSRLEGSDIKGADLRDAIIIAPQKYMNLVLDEETDFTNSVIDEYNFIDYIRKFTKKVPAKLKNKEELKLKLEKKGLPTKQIDFILTVSNLPQ
jgi:hypothetical protein